MASKRKHARNFAPTQSDYETDDAAQLASIPPPPRRTNDELNLSVLGRFEPAVTEILSHASYSVLYTFSPASGQWEKCGIEGTLFVCKLTPSPIGAERYAVFILNRRGLENFKTLLETPDNVDITDEYIILQVAEADDSPQIYGVWIFAEPPPSSTANSREDIADMVLDCARQAENTRRAAEQQQGTEVLAEAEQSVPMGRQLSLRELFGQQREQDSGFSIHDHHGGHQASVTLGHPQQPTPGPVAYAETTTPRFTSTPDTDFFHGGPRLTRPTQNVLHQVPPVTTQANGANYNPNQSALLNLFTSAGQPGHSPAGPQAVHWYTPTHPYSGVEGTTPAQQGIYTYPTHRPLVPVYSCTPIYTGYYTQDDDSDTESLRAANEFQERLWQELDEEQNEDDEDESDDMAFYTEDFWQRIEQDFWTWLDSTIITASESEDEESDKDSAYESATDSGDSE